MRFPFQPVTAGTSGEHPHRQIQITTTKKGIFKSATLFRLPAGYILMIFQTYPRAYRPLPIFAIHPSA